MRHVGYSKSGRKLRRNSDGKWVNSRGRPCKFYSATKPSAAKKKHSSKRRHSKRR